MPIRPEWNQCQHANWFFPPWHRAYLASFEAIIAATIVQLGGPANWSLPYWNYLDTTNPLSRSMPRVFTLATLPDGSANPLALMPYGPARPWPRQYTVLAPRPPQIPNDITLAAMRWPNYTSAPGVIGFGGAPTAAGELERNPHNLVHIMIGGVVGQTGFMSDPDYAGLDPIFWLHHCNIDRLWEAWISVPSHIQERGAAWSNGPAVPPFRLPDPQGQLRPFRPGDTLPGGPLAPSYDNLHRGTGIPSAPVKSTGGAMPSNVPSGGVVQSRLLSANVINTVVEPGASVSADLGLSSAALPANLAEGPQRYYLNVENIRGERPSGLLSVHVGVKSADAGVAEFVDSLPLFGLKNASDPEGAHGGDGLTMVLDITDAVEALQRKAPVALEDLQVTLEQPATGEGVAAIRVGRVSVYSAPDTRE